MLLLGLLLMAASGAFTGLLIADNLSGGPEYQVTILGHDLVTLDPLGVFLSGVALGLLFCMGLALMWMARRGRRPVRSAERGGLRRQDRPAEPARRVESAVPEDEEAPTAPPRAGHRRHLFGH